MSDDVVRSHLRKILEAWLLDGADEATRIAEIETAGGRIVSGGQTDSYGADGKAPWEIHDWRTGELLASGRSAGPEGMDEAIAILDPEETWVDVGNIVMDAEPTEVQTDGIPSSLSVALGEWMGSTGTTDEEIAEFVGWPVDKVRRCRS